MTSPLAASAGSLWMPLGVALLAGAMIPFQAGSNATLGRALGHPLWATVISLVISLVAVVPVLLALRAPPPNLAAAAQGPWWQWIGGLFGVIYITAALWLAPRMGAANFIVGAVAGQLLASMLVDHFGLVGLPARPVTLARLAGVVLVLAGICVMQWQPARATGSVLGERDLRGQSDQPRHPGSA